MDYENIRNYMGKRRFKNALHVSRTYKYIYVANAKAACSTINYDAPKTHSRAKSLCSAG